MRFEPPSKVEVSRAFFEVYGYQILIRPNETYFLNQATFFSNSMFTVWRNAFYLGDADNDADVCPPQTCVHAGANWNFEKWSREQIVDIYNDNGVPMKLVDGRFVPLRQIKPWAQELLDYFDEPIT